MAASFGSLVDDMDAAIMASLSDTTGDYLGIDGQPPVLGITLMVDKNLQQAGAAGVFLTSAVGLTWHATELATAERGGVFVVGTKRYQVEELIADDGHMLTAACMVQP